MNKNIKLIIGLQMPQGIFGYHKLKEWKELKEFFFLLF
jgi:hypothetical protein